MLQLLNRALLDMMGMMLLQHELASVTFPSSRTTDSTIEVNEYWHNRTRIQIGMADHPKPVEKTGGDAWYVDWTSEARVDKPYLMTWTRRRGITRYYTKINDFICDGAQSSATVWEIGFQRPQATIQEGNNGGDVCSDNGKVKNMEGYGRWV